MSVNPSRTQPALQRPTTSARIEYLDHRNVGHCREYRLAVHSPEGSTEVRFRIATAAFAANRVALQDGPDICYQRLLRTLAAGEAPEADAVTIDDAELTAYREAHTPAPRRSVTPKSPAKRVPVRPTPVQAHPKLPVAPSPPAARPELTFDEGQRVSHAVYGVGVTMGCSGGYTSVQFDKHGTRTFVTSMLKLERLSAPHTWEAGPRGKNRPRD